MSDDTTFGNDVPKDSDDDETTSTEENPPDTASGGAPEPTGDGK